MVVICKEDVFEWFNKLPGGKRIELMCGLLNLCIPLEWRFFATFLEQAAKRDYNSLREAETRANSPEEYEKLAAMDWLAETSTMIRTTHHQPAHPQHQSHLQASDHTVSSSVTGDEKISNGGGSQSSLSSSGDGSNLISPSSSSSINDTNSMDKHLSSPRSKIVVYLCLLSSTNRVCASIVYKALRNQLSLENITRRLFGNVIGSLNYPTSRSPMSSSQSVSSSKSSSNCVDSLLNNRPLNDNGVYPHIILDENFYSEIILLHTLAIHHPAFTFDQQTLLSEQLQKVQSTMDSMMYALAATVSTSSILSPMPPPVIPVTTGAPPPPPPPLPLTEMNHSQSHFTLNKPHVKSPPPPPLPPQSTDYLDCRSLAHELPKIVDGRHKTASPSPLPFNNRQFNCHCTGDQYDSSNNNSLGTTPSTTPPPSSGSASCQNSVNQMGPMQNGVPPPPPSGASSLNPCWFCVPPPPLPSHGPIINSYPPNQVTEQLFQYYYSVAMAAASSIPTTSNPYWTHLQSTGNPISTFPSIQTSTFPTSVNTLAQAAATFHSAKPTSQNVSCYNCGGFGHLGNDCKRPSFEEETQQILRN
ncbi:uncharacterized protein LOC141855477 [Brevipalpus obovatus]|uniref:uncharacterized protein LOC141855477 n=1 Tax=Brevipalpus obovatus TaxID=246614 RepID=UPI003D9E1563